MRRDELLNCTTVGGRYAPAWSLVLPIEDLSDRQLRKLRDQASEAAELAAGDDLAAAAFQCVREAAGLAIGGLGRMRGIPFTVAPPTHYILHLGTDPDEAVATTMAHRQVAVDLAAPFAAGEDELAATWRAWLESFAEDEFQET